MNNQVPPISSSNSNVPSGQQQPILNATQMRIQQAARAAILEQQNAAIASLTHGFQQLRIAQPIPAEYVRELIKFAPTSAQFQALIQGIDQKIIQNMLEAPSIPLTRQDLENIAKNVPNIRSITLAPNCTDQDLQYIAAHFPDLQILNVNDCDDISDNGLAHLTTLTKLTDLKLQNCFQITDDGLAHLAKLPRLTNLDLINCTRVTDTGMIHLLKSIQLKNVFINSTTISGKITRYIELKGAAIEALQQMAKQSELMNFLPKELSLVTNLYLTPPQAVLSYVQELVTLDPKSPLFEPFTNGISRDIRQTLVNNYLPDIPFTKDMIASINYESLERCQLHASCTDSDLELLVKRFPNIRNLDLHGCKMITNNGLRILQKLPHLTRLVLRNTNITDLSSLINLSQLRELDLSGTQITDFRPLLNLKKLQALDLHNCSNITDANLVHIGLLTALTHLNLSSCKKITDNGLAHFITLKHLAYLNLEACINITNQGLTYIAKLTKLEGLNLTKCRNITDDGLFLLRPLTRLENLNVSQCVNITDNGLIHLQTFTQLTNLDVSDCPQISDIGLSHLQPLTKLNSLNLTSCNKITDKGLNSLLLFKDLWELHLTNCINISDAGLANLHTLPRIRHLYLGKCSKITDTGLQHIAKCRKLLKIDLNSCHNITDKGLAYLDTLPELSGITLTNCLKLTIPAVLNLRITHPGILLE